MIYPTRSSLNRLARLAFAGNQRAFQLLVTSMSPPLRSYAERLLYGDVDAANDMVQEAWFNVLKTPEPTRYEIGLLTRMCTWQVCMKYLKAKRRRRNAETQAAKSEGVELPSHPFDADKVKNCLSRLSEVERSVVVWNSREELSFKEISGRLDWSVDRVRACYRRALTRLQICANATAKTGC